MMYLEHFGLDTAPFSITPDTRFVYGSRSQRDALNVLLMTADAGEAFVKITGEVGSGKTLLCRRFLAALKDANGAKRRFRTAYIPNPCLSPRALMMAIAMELKVRKIDAESEVRLIDSLQKALLRCAARGEQVVVCLDEAQAMPAETLESLRLLSNLETEQRKLLQIVLFGQRELDAQLARDKLRQLRSRISFSYRLDGLSLAETIAYLQHRVSVAGHAGGLLFGQAAARDIHRATHGLPRRINIVAHKSLLAAYGQGARTVDATHVAAALDDRLRRSPLAWAADLAARLSGVTMIQRINLASRLADGARS
jgi:MSHA biogenesis protein MshM